MQNDIAIFGGSFNPPINSHVMLAEDILRKYPKIEKIVFMPVSNKYDKKDLAKDLDRYNMLKLVCNKNNKFGVSDIELNSNKQLKTIETLELLQQKYINYCIYFIMGTDNLKELEQWKDPDKLLKNFKIIVLNRDKDNIEDIIEKSDLLKKYKDNIISLKNKTVNLSSTFIREKIKNKENVEEFINKDVLKYIKERKLYI